MLTRDEITRTYDWATDVLGEVMDTEPYEEIKEGLVAMKDMAIAHLDDQEKLKGT